MLGDSGDDVLYGGTGNDVLIGGKGRDLLWGGAGADEFRLAVIDEGVDAHLLVDSVVDFEVGLDSIRIRADMISNLTPKGMPDPGLLSFDVVAGSAAQCLLVDGFADGASRLFFDSNGAGAGGTLLARLENDPALTASDIFII
jgi:serralysin